MQKLSSALPALFFPFLAVAGLLALGGGGPSRPASLPLSPSSLPSAPPSDAEAVREEIRVAPVQQAQAVAQAQGEIALWSARLRASGGTDADAAHRLNGWRSALALRRARERAFESASRTSE